MLADPETHHGAPSHDSAASWAQLLGKEVSTENHAIWETYREHARDHDEKYFKRWHETCDVLLVFAALFSAVLTAFLVESSKSLEQDYTKYTAVLLYTVLSYQNDDRQFRLPPRSALQPPSAFASSTVTRWVNGLWFASLTLSLGACVMCLWAKQWLENYDARVNAGTDSLRQWARRRALYYRGGSRWDLTGFIMALPLVMHLAVFLFFSGLALSLLPEDLGVGVLVIVLSGIILLLYFSTIILAVWKLESPYSTPLLRRVYNFAHYMHKRADGALDWLDNIVNDNRTTERTERRSFLSALFRGVRAWLRMLKCESYTSQEQSATNDMDPVALGWLMRTTLDDNVQSAGLHVVTAMLHTHAKHLAGKLAVAQAMKASADAECKSAMFRHYEAATAANAASASKLRPRGAGRTYSAKLYEAEKRLKELSHLQANLVHSVNDARTEVHGLVSALTSSSSTDEEQLPYDVSTLSADRYVRRAASRFITNQLAGTDVLHTLLSSPMEESRIRSLCTILSLAPLAQFDFNLSATFPAWRRIFETLKYPVTADGKSSWIYQLVQFFGPESNGIKQKTRLLDKNQSAWQNLISQKSSELRYACIVPIADLIAEELCVRQERGDDITAMRAEFFLPAFDVSRMIAYIFRSSTNISPFETNFKALRGQKEWIQSLNKARRHTVSTFWLAMEAMLLKPELVASKADELSGLRLCALRCMRALECQTDAAGDAHHSRMGTFVDDDDLSWTTALAGVLPENDFGDTDVGPSHEDIPSLAALWSKGRIRDVEIGLKFMAYWLTLAPRVGQVSVLPGPKTIVSRASLADSRLLVWNSPAEMREFLDLWALRPPLLHMVVMVPMPGLPRTESLSRSIPPKAVTQ